MTRVRAFLLPVSWLPKSQKGLGNTRVPRRHVTQGQANVPKGERSYFPHLLVLYVLHGAAGTEMDTEAQLKGTSLHGGWSNWMW